MTAGYTYDSMGRVATTTYPSAKGTPAFAVLHDYDAFGHLLGVRDSATKEAYWRLTAVDGAGRYQAEVFGNGVITDRSYFPDREALKSITTKRGLTSLQALGFEYNELASLKSRTDANQPQNKTERFRYDPLERLTCAYFSINEDPLAPCAQSFQYAPNGNLTFKSDVGALAYTDLAHPHAVTSAGADSFSYNAVGNQVTRPGGTTIKYSPFDLPASITQGASTTTLGYDGDQARIRKTTPTEETLYLSDLYERVTDAAFGLTEHRYYVKSPERAVAVVTRGGASPGVRYLHVDQLGSVNVLTTENGAPVEPRSYDAFGQRRNPLWGQPPPASFTTKTTRGFTGHEVDHELGLINAKGRIFDPKVGRFLTTDPIIANLYSGQSLNSYSYVVNNPLTLVDPSGFQPMLPGSELALPGGPVVWIFGTPREPKEPAASDDPALFGARGSSDDVGTTGDAASDGAAQPGGPSLDDFRRNPYVQLEGAFIGGVLLGLVPFGGTGQQVLDAGGVLPHGSIHARIGFSIGLTFGGIVGLLAGVGGDIVGGAATGTGVGAPVGVPVIVVSTVVAVGGLANIAAGVTGLVTALSQGSGSSGPPTAAPGSGRPDYSKIADPKNVETSTRPTPRQVREMKAANRAANSGELRSDLSGKPMVDSAKSQSGVTPPSNEAQVDHIVPVDQGGTRTQSNLQLITREENRAKWNQ